MAHAAAPLAALGVALAATALAFGGAPRRFDLLARETSGCPLHAMRFNASCSGINMARGDEFEMVLKDIEVGWQNLYVSATVYNLENAEHGVIATKLMRQAIQVRDEDDEPWQDVGAAKEVDWPLSCKQSEPACDEAFVLLRSGLPNRQMRLSLSVATDENDPLDESEHHVEWFMGDVVFHIRHETTSFTRFETVLRYSMVIVSLISLWRYFSSFRLPGGTSIPLSEWQPAQQALVVLMVANLLNNNPLFILWAWYGAWYMQLVEGLEQSFLLYAVVLWVLVMFDGMTLTKYARGSFWLGKLLLVGTLWVLDSSELILYQVTLRNDLSAVKSDLPLYPWLWVYTPKALQGLVFLYILTVFFKALLRTTNGNMAAKTSFSKLVRLATLSAVCLGVARPDQLEDDDFSSLWIIVSMGALNAYVVILGLAFEPNADEIEAFARTAEQRLEAARLLEAAAQSSSAMAIEESSIVAKLVTTLQTASNTIAAIPWPLSSQAMPLRSQAQGSVAAKGSKMADFADEDKEAVVSSDDQMMSTTLEHLSCRSLAHLVTIGALLTMLVSGIAAGRLPTRFEYISRPTRGCPSPLMRFNASCSGINMARGDNFEMVLKDIEVGWQNLYVSATVYNRENAEHGVIATELMRQDVHVRDEDDEPWQDVGAAKEVDWPLSCKQSEPACDEAFVLLRSGLPDRQMRLSLSVATDENDPLDESKHHVERFMGDVVFHFRHETTSFTRFETVLRYSMAIASLISLWRYFSSFRLPGGASIPLSEWQPAQQALVVLMVANLLNNNPLFILWAWYGAWYMQLVEGLEQSFLLYAVVLWVLVVFDGMTLTSYARGSFWLGKLLLVGTLWVLDSSELILYELTLRNDLSAVKSDLPLYPWLWVYIKDLLVLLLMLYMLTTIFKAFIVLTADSKLARLKFSSFVATAALSALCLGVARPDQLEDDDFSSLWVLASMASLNAYVILLGLAFAPADGAIAAFVLSAEQRVQITKTGSQGIQLIQQIASTTEPSSLYNEELFVKTVSSKRGVGLTLEQEQIIDVTVQRNPVMNKSVHENPEPVLLTSLEHRITPKLNRDEDVPPGSLITLVRGRATCRPNLSASIADLWLGNWFCAGPPPSAINNRRFFEGITTPAMLADEELISCVAEGPLPVLVRIYGPVAVGEKVVAKCERIQGAPRIYAAADRGLNNILAQTIGYLEEAVSAEVFAAAALGAKHVTEEEIHFPYAIVMKDVCDELLLSEASCKQVTALKQAVQRAVAMKAETLATADIEKTRSSKGEPRSTAKEAVVKQETGGAESSRGTDSSEEADLELQLSSGDWKSESPRSSEERDALVLLGDHFDVRLFHIKRDERKKVLLLLRMKPSALKRELLDFLLERWENEGKRAVSSASGSRFTEVGELVSAVEAGELKPTPAEKLELYERLLRKLFHAAGLGHSRLPAGSLAGLKKGGTQGLREQHELEMDKRFSPVSFKVWERPKDVEDLTRAELISLLDHFGVEVPATCTTAELRHILVVETDYEKSRELLAGGGARQAAIERGACFELIETVFPRHHQRLNEWVQHKLTRTTHLSNRDLTVVRNHYGEELALYMAFMNKYNETLLPFALLGALVFILCLLLPGTYAESYTYIAPLYCVCMVIFSALFQMLWAHENQRLKYDWGITDYVPADYVRPEFKGEKQWDFVRQRLAYEFPEWKRCLKIRPLSMFVLLLMTLVLMIVTFALYMQLQDSLENPNPAYDYDVLRWLFNGSLELPLRTVLGSGLNGILYGVLIMVIYMSFFSAVAHQLTRMENYRTEREFHDEYVLKMFFFIFVDGYMMFWIIGLFNIPLAMYSSFEELADVKVLGIRLFYKEGQVGVYQEGLTAVCVTAIITVQLLTFLLENVLPFVIKYYEHKGKQPLRASLTARERFVHAICDEAEREPFDLFGDYYDSVLFLGYGVVYSLLWPLAPIVNYANNMVELRADLSKVVEIFRRPTPRKTATIGMWESCMWFQTFTSTIQLAILGAFSTPIYDEYMRTAGFPPEEFPALWETHGNEIHVRRTIKIICCIALMVVGFAIILLVQWAIGNQDPQTRLRLARDDFLERKASVEQWEAVRLGGSALNLLSVLPKIPSHKSVS